MNVPQDTLIGDNTTISRDVRIGTAIGANTTTSRDVGIGTGVTIGSNVRVDRFVTIADGTVVADGEHLRRPSRRQVLRNLLLALLARLGF